MRQRKEPVKTYKIAFSTTNAQDLVDYDALKSRGFSHVQVYQAGLLALLNISDEKK